MDTTKKIIQEVQISKSHVYPGESVLVTVQAQHPNDLQQRVDVVIDGVPGNTQYLQFAGAPGKRIIRVNVFTPDDLVETEQVELHILPSKHQTKYPLLSVQHNAYHNITADFTILNANKLRMQDGYYLWDFGDGQQSITKTAFTSHYYGDSLDNEQPYTSFHVKVSLQDGRSASRTLAVWNMYYFDKQIGIIKPRVESDGEARRSGQSLIGTYSIRNMENEPISFTSQRIEFQYFDPAHLSTPSEAQECNIEVGGKRVSKQNVELSNDSIPANVFGFAVHLNGNTRSGMKARLSAYFDFRENPLTAKPVNDQATIDILEEIRNRNLLSNLRVITIEDISRLVHEGKIKLSPMSLKTSFSKGCDIKDTVELPKIGDKCNPETCVRDPNEGEEGLTCQLTDEPDEDTYIPGRIRNALKGDILLSNGGSSPMGRMLRQLFQKYSHCGIMSMNYYAVRHSTASDDWLKFHSSHSAEANKALGDKIGTEIGPLPLSGFKAPYLKYLWPGTITQCIDAAYNGEEVPDREGRTYNIRSFNSGLTEEQMPGAFSGSGLEEDPITYTPGPWVIIGPRVVKPAEGITLKEIEESRKRLHLVAEKAMELNGHYRFFGYTDGAIGLKKAYDAPDSVSWFDTKGTRATMCSSFIWTAVKEVAKDKEKTGEQASFQLEGLGRTTKEEDLERPPFNPLQTADIVPLHPPGAKVDDETLDGLYFYPENDRKIAANYLHDYLYNLVLATIKEKGLLASALFELEPFSDTPDHVANQIVNTFASDWAEDDSINSRRWRHPHIGRSVSPDDILFWDSPHSERNTYFGLYGHSEDLLPSVSRWEKRRVNRWVRETGGLLTLDGVVKFQSELVPDALVTIACRETFTDSSGHFSVNIPGGWYLAKAGKLDKPKGWYLAGELPVDVRTGVIPPVVIELKPPSEFYRLIRIEGSYHAYETDATENSGPSDGLFIKEVQVGPYGYSW